MEESCQGILDDAGRTPFADRRGLPARQEAGREIRMTATFCVFNRTRESFLCLSAIGALSRTSPNVSEMGWELRAGTAKPDREDGVWLMRSASVYTVGRQFPVDRVYLDQENRVIQLIEHLDPLQIVPVRCRYASVLEVRIRTIYSSRTRVGDELLICLPEDVRMQWDELQMHRAWTRKGVVPCSKG
jgi:hypothetical protein